MKAPTPKHDFRPILLFDLSSYKGDQNGHKFSELSNTQNTNLKLCPTPTVGFGSQLHLHLKESIISIVSKRQAHISDPLKPSALLNWDFSIMDEKKTISRIIKQEVAGGEKTNFQPSNSL